MHWFPSMRDCGRIVRLREMLRMILAKLHLPVEEINAQMGVVTYPRSNYLVAEEF